MERTDAATELAKLIRAYRWLAPASACDADVAPLTAMLPPHPQPYSPKIRVTSLRTIRSNDRIVGEKGASAFAAFLHFLRSLFINVSV